MYTAEQSMPDHRLAKARSGYEGYVYQPARPNPPVMFDCAQVAKTWRDHYEPETPRSFREEMKNSSEAVREHMALPYEHMRVAVSPEALAVCERSQSAWSAALKKAGYVR